MDKRILYFTQKLNQLRIKEATFKASGYGTPEHIKKDIRLIEIALKQLNNSPQ